MSHGDPTDNALAAIASILDQPPVIPRERQRQTTEAAAQELPATPPPLEEPTIAVPPPLEAPPPLESAPAPEAALPVEAPAAPEASLPETPPPLPAEADPQPAETQAVEARVVEAQAVETPTPVVDAPIDAPVEAHGYSRIGPGPMAAIRFKWTVREEGSDYYVDETIGEHSTPVVKGPMSREAAIQLVNDHEADARRRFEQIKSEMAGRATATNPVRKDSES